jgi:hypothetical protein
LTEWFMVFVLKTNEVSSLPGFESLTFLCY